MAKKKNKDVAPILMVVEAQEIIKEFVCSRLSQWGY